MGLRQRELSGVTVSSLGVTVSLLGDRIVRVPVAVAGRVRWLYTEGAGYLYGMTAE
jgi:hypothetical protein